MSYLQPVITEFAAMGMEVSISQKKKSAITSINSAFLKPDTLWSELELEKLVPQSGLSRPPAIKIKIEVDKEPPPGFQTEELLLLKPFSFYVKCFTLPAGKMHALLFRKWKQRVKGRDWYDMEWYIRKGVGLNLDHFHQRAINNNDLENKKLTEKQFRKLLDERIDAVSINAIKEDIIRFIPHPEQLDIWSREYFHDLVKKIKIAV
jgi:hypothetical protein